MGIRVAIRCGGGSGPTGGATEVERARVVGIRLLGQQFKRSGRVARGKKSTHTTALRLQHVYGPRFKGPPAWVHHVPRTAAEAAAVPRVDHVEH